jgi:hypothetical protein
MCSWKGSTLKNNIDFYQHYANSDQHPKFKMLRAEFGWGGEGRFWALNNRIAEAEGCCLDVSKKYNLAAIASDLNFSLDELDKFLKFLLEDCELIRTCPNGKITTDIIQECFLRVMSDREKARDRAARRWSKQADTSPEKNNFSPEKVCIVKESKVNKIKEKKKKIKEKYDFRSFEFPNWVDHEMFVEFCENRSRLANGKINSEMAMNGLVNKLKRLIDAGYDQTEIITESITNNWKGLFPPKNPTNGTPNLKPQTYAQAQDLERRMQARAILEDDDAHDATNNQGVVQIEFGTKRSKERR